MEKTRDNKGQFKKGHKGLKPKGAKAKINRDVKEMILAAAYDKRLDGVTGLIKFAIKNDRNKALFYGWLFKMLPSNLSVEGDLNLKWELSEKYMPDKKKEKDEPE